MLFKFKSRACPDLIMLEADGRRILKAMLGDDPIKGIVQVADLGDALSRLEQAVALDEAMRQAQAEQSQRPRPDQDLEGDDPGAALPSIRLSQRAAPMQKMLRRCMEQEADLVWGV